MNSIHLFERWHVGGHLSTRAINCERISPFRATTYPPSKPASAIPLAQSKNPNIVMYTHAHMVNMPKITTNSFQRKVTIFMR
mmetsp:Transcript_11628/g.43700  ORF Transcript_11628/g.43700 Transcript_11628/m.43700 type:complete len:82 (-) Transcript_11628:1504-1749(-)